RPPLRPPGDPAISGEFAPRGGGRGSPPLNPIMADVRMTSWVRTLGAAGLALGLLLPAGCQQEMARQPSYKPLDPSTFFPDGRSARPLVPGTVARGHLRTDLPLFTGKRTREGGDLTLPAAFLGPAGQPPLAALALVGAEGQNDVDTFPFP